MTAYLAELMLRLADGMGRLGEDARGTHGEFLKKAQRDDGGFAGRQGPCDPYYTSFALRGLILLDAVDEPAARRSGSFLQAKLQQPLSSVDFLSAVFGAAMLEGRFGIEPFRDAGLDRTGAVAAMLASRRRADGGFAKSPDATTASTYHTFLASAAGQLVGIEPADAEQKALVELIRSRRRDDGGFAEVPQIRHGGVNPTGAAVGLLKMLDALNDDVRGAAVGFLTESQTAEGGFRAHGRIPVADLLSTFTALNALADLDALDRADLETARRFVHSLALPGGGFLAGPWDDSPDVEYTFYGLAALALLG